MPNVKGDRTRGHLTSKGMHYYKRTAIKAGTLLAIPLHESSIIGNHRQESVSEETIIIMIINVVNDP